MFTGNFLFNIACISYTTLRHSKIRFYMTDFVIIV